MNELLQHLIKTYKRVQINEGNEHTYLGMKLTFKTNGELNVDMSKYINELLNEYNITGTCNTPASNYLFDIMENSPLLDNDNKELYHTITAKLLYLAKRARPDILLAVI